jgi:hypothetical protein
MSSIHLDSGSTQAALKDFFNAEDVHGQVASPAADGSLSAYFGVQAKGADASVQQQTTDATAEQTVTNTPPTNALG